MASIIAQRLEKCLIPSPDTTLWNEGAPIEVPLATSEKVQHYVANIFLLIGNLALFPFAAAYSLANYTVDLFKESEPVTKLPSGPVDAKSLPEHFGFADSLFQTSGLGTSASATPLEGTCDWDKWLNPKRIEGTKAGEDYRKFFVDILGNPEPFINILREMNVNAHRFSLEWSVIEPQPGQYNLEAIALYRNFIKQLKANGIEPYVTLHHFVCPEWFGQTGGFERLENVETFKKHALKMMEFFPEVQNWIPFNEINVDAFQKCVRGVYPPGREGDLAGAARMMRNMLIANCQIYKEAKAKWPELQIGSSHQWLNFEPLEGNPLEKLICYFLSKITHYACYDFFKTGKFSLEVPGKANVQFSIPEEEFKRNNGFSDFIGVQFYGYPRLKAGFNWGQDYPGYKIINFCGLTFGSTCPKGGKVMSFGPGYYPESIYKCMIEAIALKKPIVISETGCDARMQKWGEKKYRIDEFTQREYFQKIMPILAKFKDHIKALFVWTVPRNHLEWDRRDFPQLGVVDIEREDQKITGYRLSPAAKLMSCLYAAKRKALEKLNRIVA